MDDVLTFALTQLSPRVERLERQLGEQTMLLTMLLGRSGLDAEGIERAYKWAAEAWQDVLQKAGQQASEKWLATPEGQEAYRLNQEAFNQRIGELWREDCRMEGRILSDPRAAKTPSETS